MYLSVCFKLSSDSSATIYLLQAMSQAGAPDSSCSEDTGCVERLHLSEVGGESETKLSQSCYSYSGEAISIIISVVH